MAVVTSCENREFSQAKRGPTSFPGSLFSATTRETEKIDSANEVERGQPKVMVKGAPVRLTVFRNRNTWKRKEKSFVFTEIHIKIVKHLLTCYFKHIFFILVASKR